MLHDAPNGVESGKFAIASEVLALHPCKALQFGNPCLSLKGVKITDFHSPLPLQKLARHSWRDSRDLHIRPAATPRGWRILLIVELSVGHLKHRRVVDVLFS